MKSKWMGLLLVAVICLIGEEVFAQRHRKEVRKQARKYKQVLKKIDARYTDTVNFEALTDTAITKIISTLDPHSDYVSRKDAVLAEAEDQGEYAGVGLQYSVLRDTIVVARCIVGSPAEKAGIRKLNRMISLNGENVVGKKPADLLDKLVGKKGEHVKMEMMRGKERMEFDLVLDIIPIPTVEAAYMVDSTMGYLKLTYFSENAAKEFKKAMQKLQNQGMKDLILDLQGNLGGDLQAAADIIDQFLDGKKMITYLDGRSIRDTFWYTWRATPEGLFQKGRLVVLVNRKSASASELLSGAVQDWDRGLIVGRRTFGKGCAQGVFYLRDASLLNLTFAHFYTPSGRCLQKLYKGKEDYWGETNRRDSTGELVNADNIRVTDTVKYYTKLRHRLVYGGGGVIPDIFVPVDTAKYWDYLDSLSDKNVVYDYIVDYVDKQLDQLEKTYPTFADFRERFEVTDEMIGQLVAAGEEKGVKKVSEFHRLVSYLKSAIKANIAKFVWDENEYRQIMNEETDSFKAAVKALRDGTYEQKMGEEREAKTTFGPTSRKEGEVENEKKE